MACDLERLRLNRFFLSLVKWIHQKESQTNHIRIGNVIIGLTSTYSRCLLEFQKRLWRKKRRFESTWNMVFESMRTSQIEMLWQRSYQGHWRCFCDFFLRLVPLRWHKIEAITKKDPLCREIFCAFILSH